MRSGRVFLAKANSLAFTLIMVLTLFLVMYPSDLSTSAEPLERPEDVRTIQLVFSGIGISDTQISMDGEGRLDLVWVDVRDGNEEIYFLKTETNGWKLHDDMRLTVSTDRSIMPTLCPTKGYTTTLAWVEETITGLHTLMTTTLKYDGGDIFLIAEPRSIVSDVHLSGCPVLKPSDNGNAYIMWAEGLVDNRSCVRMAEIDPLSNDKPTPQVVFPNLGSINYIDFEPLSGSDFIASWNGQYIPDGSTDVNYGIFFTRFTLGGEVHVQPVRKSITSSDTRPDIDHFDGAISIVFSTRRYAYQDVLFTSFDMNGSDIIDDTPISDLISNNIDPSLSIGQDGTYSVIWSRGSNVSWTMVCLGLDPTALQSGSIIPEILAENTVSPGHPPSQVITAEGDLYTCFIHEGSRTGIHLISRERPDLKVQWVGFIDTGHDPVVLENVTLFADVLNLWNANISGLEITFTISLEGSVVFHDGYLTYFLPSAINRRTLNWTPILEGSYTLTVKVDPEDILQERNESNDQLTTVFLVGRQEMDLSVRSGSGVLPDEIGELKITLENRGTVTTTYDLLVKGDVIEWFSKTTTSLEVPPGQERTIIFPYRAPDGTLAGNYMILVTGSSTREKKDPVMVAHDLIILPRYNSSVDFGNYNREIDPGITYTMPITVDNFGNCWIKYTLSGNSSLGAPLRYNGMHLPQTLPPIQSGSSLEVLIEMDVPEGMEPGRSIKVDLSLLNQQAGQTFSASYNMSIMEMPKPGLEIEDENLELDGRWISKLVTVKVRNIGNVRDIFDFEASAQTGDWDARVIDPYSRSVALSPGEEINVTMSIIPPPIPSEGTKMFMFKATPMLRESMNQEISFNIQVGKKFNVTFTQSRIELNTEPGEKHRLMLTYTNTGNQDASFSLIFSGAGSDGLFVEPITGGRMQWNESVPIQIVSGGTNTFWIEVTIPSEMKDNRLKINVTCMEDTSVSDEMEIALIVPANDLLKKVFMVSMVALAIATAGIIAVVTKVLMKRRTKAGLDLLEDEI